jgi:hypothetical protein
MAESEEPPDPTPEDPPAKKPRTTAERFKQHESEKTKQKGKGKGDPKKGDPKGKGKGDKGKKGSKVDSTLVPPNLAQLSVAFTTQSVDTHVGVMPGHLLKVVQIGRDLTSVKMASTKADKVRFSAFLLMCMDVTALEIAVLSLYTRAEDTLVMPRGPGGNRFTIDAVTRPLVNETMKTVVVSSISSHRLKYCGASIHDERYAQLPIMTAELEADRQDGTEAVFIDDPETCNSRTPYPGWALNFLSSALSTVEMVWFTWGLCNALPFDTISELCCRAVWGVAVWNEAPPIFGGLNRYQRRVEVLRKTYTSNVSASCMNFVNDVLRRTLPDSENDLIDCIHQRWSQLGDLCWHLWLFAVL